MDEYTAQNTETEPTTATEPEQTEPEQTDTEPTTTTDQDAGTSADESNSEAAADVPFLNVRYNKEDRGLTEEEARAWAQKGMKYEQTYNALFRVAAAAGQKPEDFLTGMESAQRDRYESELRERYGDDDDAIDKLMRLYDIERADRISAAEKAVADASEAEKQSLEQRLADEFAQLQKEFPDLKNFSDLPKSVVKSASDGMPLPYAYLLHQHFENKKIQEATKGAEAAQKASTGAIDTSEHNEGGMDAFQRAFWSS